VPFPFEKLIDDPAEKRGQYDDQDKGRNGNNKEQTQFQKEDRKGDQDKNRNKDYHQSKTARKEILPVFSPAVLIQIFCHNLPPPFIQHCSEKS
jgi:hypothetical protein